MVKCCKCGEEANCIVQDKWYCFSCYEKYTNFYKGGAKAYE